MKLPFFILSAMLLAVTPTCADVLDDIKKSGVMIWGADQSGGGPYISPDPKDVTKQIGFEVEIASELAKELGVRAEFSQGQWELIPPRLDKGEIHIALNGFEAKPAIARDYLMSRPYYVFGLQLMARADGPLKTWDDLKRIGEKSPIHIGVLNTSAAQQYVETECRDFAKAESFDETTGALTAVENGQIDACLQDDCASIFYAERFSKLRLVGRPVGHGVYVVLMKKSETRLKEAIDAAFDKMIADGRLEKIYDKWSMHGKLQSLLIKDAGTATAANKMSFAEVFTSSFPLLLSAAGMTVLLSFASMPLAIALGILIAIGRLYGPAPVRWLGTLYVEFVRGTPLMLQLYAIYFLLPKIGISVPPLAAGIIGLAINYSAYEAEIYRAGLQAIPKGQWEAALALGMTRRQALWRIVLPQAFRIVIPPVTNDFIALFKDTSVCSVVTVMELTKQYNILAMSTGAIVEMAILTSLLYLAMSYPLSLFARWSEAKLGVGRPVV